MGDATYDYNPGAGKRKIGLIVVILLHILIIWSLVSGLARKAVEIVKKPVEMKILVEAPPPPPPPPRMEKLQEAPKVQAPPPPPFVPLPDITPVNPPPTPVIQATQAEPPLAPPVIAPPPAPPAPPPPPAPPARAEASVACPGYQKTLQAALQGAFDKVGIEGTVQVLLRIKGDQIIDVSTQSGPRDYYRLVQSAVRRMHCSAGGANEVITRLDVSFREE